MSKSNGQINYEGFARLRKEAGYTLPTWTWLEHEDRIAWEAGAQAVAEHVLPHGVGHEHSTVEASKRGTAELLGNFEAKVAEGTL